jgi:hypothetical protein
MMGIEHFVPRSRDRSRRDDYTNCFYICGLCNSSRHNTENYVPDGPSLLNPCDSAWGEHFEAKKDEIRPRCTSDADAAYTLETYDFNDPRKVVCRSMRRRLICQCYSYLEPAKSAHEELLDRAESEGDPGAVDLAREVHALQWLAWLDILLRYQAVPTDANANCRCKASGHLPPGLDDQSTLMSSSFFKCTCSCPETS